MTRDDLKNLEATLWQSADTLRANSDLKSTEYSTPVLGLIFLKFADNKYSQHEKEILKEYEGLKGTRREKPISEIAVEKCGFYLPDHARYDYLLNLPEETDIDQKIKKAMEAIEVLEKRHKDYQSKFDIKDLNNTNKIQRKLAESFQPFFIEIHEMLRSIDKKVRNFEKDHPNKKETRTIKEELTALHQEIKDAEYFFSHINWLQERSPKARYEV